MSPIDIAISFVVFAEQGTKVFSHPMQSRPHSAHGEDQCFGDLGVAQLAEGKQQEHIPITRRHRPYGRPELWTQTLSRHTIDCM